MAQQAILAAQRRRWQTSEDPISGTPSGLPTSALAKAETLRQALQVKRNEVYKLFNIWDEDGSGAIDRTEFRRAVRMLGLKANHDDFAAFCTLCDTNHDGQISLDEITTLLEQPIDGSSSDTDEAPRKRSNILVRICAAIYGFIGTTSVQTVLYFAFVLIFNALTSTLRLKEEYYLDKAFNDALIDNAFDAHINTFADIRRVSDVWEWGNTVLWPGLLGNSGPSCGAVGLSGSFNSATDVQGAVRPDDLASGGAFKGGCNDDSWPDGGGTFHASHATSYTVDELVERFNELDWTTGLLIWQMRVNRQPMASCLTDTIGGSCLPGVSDAMLADATSENTTSFGFNWTHPNEPLSHPFRYFSPAESGADPLGSLSANPASLQTYAGGGFLSIILPFFSEVRLPDERGPASSVTDHRLHLASRDTGRTPNYFCVRLVWNGDHLHQLCDPNDPATGRTTGLVRAAVEEFWNDLKRAHYIDSATRAMSITLGLSSNNAGVRARATLMFEFTSPGAVLSSFDSLTRVSRHDLLESTGFYCWIAFGFTVFFAVLEFAEIVGDGPVQYFQNMWNVMDWLNYIVFFQVWWTLRTFLEQVVDVPCSELCVRTGYQDDWESMSTIRQGKFYLSACVCIQLLKVIKFTSELVPKMGLAPMVLKKALPDLVFFTIVFFITMIAFSSLFFIQLGPYMAAYATPEGSVIATGRALFGDFDIDKIIDNSSGYMNTLLFLLYLFVAVFIMLSMFFAILGESQANLRDEQRDAKSRGEDEPEYGVFYQASEIAKRSLMRAPLVGPRLVAARQEQRAEELRKERAAEPTAVDRIEARQLALTDDVAKIASALASLTQAVGELNKSTKLLASRDVPAATDSPTSGDEPTQQPRSVADDSSPTRTRLREGVRGLSREGGRERRDSHERTREQRREERREQAHAEGEQHSRDRPPPRERRADSTAQAQQRRDVEYSSKTVDGQNRPARRSREGRPGEGRPVPSMGGHLAA